MSGSLATRLYTAAMAPRDAAGLVAFRVAFGLLVFVSALRFLAYGWVGELFTKASFRFSYFGFGWVPPLHGAQVTAAFAALMVLGLMVAVGLFYRIAMPLLFVLFSWVQLTDVSNYLNHYYLVSLLALLMCFMPLHRAWSVDAVRNPPLSAQAFPAWCTWLLRFQVGTVYLFAGLAKLNADWLLHGQPLNIWLSARSGLPLVGPLLATREAAMVAAWSGFLFDSTVPLFLSIRRTRPIAYLAVLGFHLATWLLFPIGMFPAIMVTAALVFFDPSWPRALLARLGRVSTFTAPSAERSSPARWVVVPFIAAAVWCAVQVALPLRAHVYGGDVSWHEQGMRFSWRVMTREKNGSVTFVVKNAAGREWHVSPRRYLTRVQEREMASQPDLILQLAQHIGAQWQAEGHGPVSVHADALVSLNGRPAQRFIDDQVDLMTVRDTFFNKEWVLPGPTSAPLHLKAVASR